jgi:hypothetical protein
MFGDFSSTRAASRVGSGRDPEAARKRRGCERCSSFREMNRSRTRLIPPFLRKFPGLNVVLGSRLTIGTKRTDVGTSFLVLSWADNQKRMSPGILGFRLECLVLNPLLGRGTFATIGKPMLKDHGPIVSTMSCSTSGSVPAAVTLESRTKSRRPAQRRRLSQVTWHECTARTCHFGKSSE